jgi:hypothetical protein
MCHQEILEYPKLQNWDSLYKDAKVFLSPSFQDLAFKLAAATASLLPGTVMLAGFPASSTPSI